MRCKACDKKLSDFESTRRYANTDEFIDLCNHCFSTIEEDVEYSEREDLLEYEDYDETI